MDLAPFIKMLKERTGLNYEKQFLAKLRDIIADQMVNKKIQTPDEYFKLLHHDQDEFTVLLNSLTINETYFFREPIHLKTFSEILIPELLARINQTRKLKVLSAGCSTGEELYSIAMMLWEIYGPEIGHLFSLIGADIDSDAIRRAKEGIYARHSHRNTDSHFLNTYFEVPNNGTYKIKKFIREKVAFQVCNLLSAPFQDNLKEMDVIFYRNVSIYFDPEMQKRVFLNLSRILNKNGYLIVGSTETLPHDLKILSLIERGGAFLFFKSARLEDDPKNANKTVSQHPAPLKRPARKASPARSRKTDLKKIFPLTLTKIAPDRRPQTTQDTSYDEAPCKNQAEHLEKALSLASRKRFPEALKILDAVLTSDVGCLQAYALKAGILINLNRVDAAKDVCLKILAKDALHLESYLLLGIIARNNEDAELAIKRFKEALYVKSACWLAHFHLAELSAQHGPAEQARKEYQIVKNLLKKNGIAEPGISLFPINTSAQQMINLCRQKIETFS